MKKNSRLKEKDGAVGQLYVTNRRVLWIQLQGSQIGVELPIHFIKCKEPNSLFAILPSLSTIDVFYKKHT